jgi:hypothetical protein
MTACGEGKAPGKSHLLTLAKEAAIEEKIAKEIMARTESAIAEWASLARQFGVYSENIALIEKKHSEIRKN